MEHLQKIEYGQSITWTDLNGNITRVSVDGRSTADNATKDAIEHAKAFGWSPPKWWQWWRRRDTRPDMSLFEE